jgi:hypothetical protein
MSSTFHEVVHRPRIAPTWLRTTSYSGTFVIEFDAAGELARQHTPAGFQVVS